MRVIVIGAGVIGCAAAYELSRRGARVTLVDMRRPGNGATNASAGVLAPHIESHSPEFLQLAASSLSMYDGFMERLRGESFDGVEYRRCGSIEIALNQAQQERLRARADAYSASGVEHRLLGREQAREMEPALAADVIGGLLVPTHGFVSARPLTAALAAGAERHGAVIASDFHVDRITTEAREVRASGRHGVFVADAAVIAAGSWSGQIAIERSSAVAVKPIRGQLLHLASAAPLLSRVLWGSRCYLVPWADGTLLAGATTEDVGFDEGATVAGVRELLEAACEMLPAALNARFNDVRVGLRPSSPDGLPIVGRAAAVPNVVYATGHYRNGVLLAPLTAAAVADLVLDGTDRPELALTRPARFGL